MLDGSGMGTVGLQSHSTVTWARLCLWLVTVFAGASLSTAHAESPKSRCERLLLAFAERANSSDLVSSQDDYGNLYRVLKATTATSTPKLTFKGSKFTIHGEVSRRDDLLDLRIDLVELAGTDGSYTHQGSGLSLRFAKILYIIHRFAFSELNEHPELGRVRIRGMSVRNAQLLVALKEMGFEAPFLTLRRQLLTIGVWGGTCLTHYALTGDYRGAMAVATMALFTQAFVTFDRLQNGAIWTLNYKIHRDSLGAPQLCSI